MFCLITEKPIKFLHMSLENPVTAYHHSFVIFLALHGTRDTLQSGTKVY